MATERQKSFDNLKSDDEVRKIIENAPKLDLADHFTPNESEAGCLIGSHDAIVEFIKRADIITLEMNELNDIYYRTNIDEAPFLFDIDVSKSFKKSDIWLSQRMVNVSMVFSNYVDGAISNEMTYFLCSLNIALLLGGVFMEEFLEFSSLYDYSSWRSGDEFVSSFEELVSNWLETGSKIIKMAVSATKYSILNEKKNISVQLSERLPEDVALKLENVEREISVIRFNYDRIKL